MKLHKNVCRISLLALGFALSFGVVSQAQAAGNWGLSIAYNNPAGANIGGNLTYFGSQFAFEIGVGSVGGNSNDKSAAGGLGGDIDLKILFGSKLRPYLEGGFALGVGAGVGEGAGFSLGAGSPFVGGGLLYDAQQIFFYGAADYKFNPSVLYPVFGVGVKF